MERFDGDDESGRPPVGETFFTDVDAATAAAAADAVADSMPFTPVNRYTDTSTEGGMSASVSYGDVDYGRTSADNGLEALLQGVVIVPPDAADIAGVYSVSVRHEQSRDEA